MQENKSLQIVNIKEGKISRMMGRSQMYGVLHHLEKVLKLNLEGDVVELGCNVGTTSINIRRLLDEYKTNKEFHVYDSWQGLPKKLLVDLNKDEKRQFKEGHCRTSKSVFQRVFKLKKLKEPIIHSGWFKQIPDEEYPDKICFAFLDGDFYSSIMDSLNKIYHKMVRGGIIIIDDCGWSALPGCQKAIEDFLKDKREILEHTGYPNSNLDFGKNHFGGKIVILS